MERVGIIGSFNQAGIMQLRECEVDHLLMRQEIRTIGTMMRDREAERTRIAKDLHDRLGGMLSAAKFQFSALGSRLDLLGTEQGQQYQSGLDLLDTVVNEVRRISMELSMSSSRFGLTHALEELKAKLCSLGTLEVHMSFFGLEERLDQRLEMDVYRIVQHCISDALKRANAATLSVQLTRGPAMINILVEDDGPGGDPGAAGYGGDLDRLNRRTGELGGTINIDRRRGHGTTVSIDIPLIRTI